MYIFCVDTFYSICDDYTIYLGLVGLICTQCVDVNCMIRTGKKLVWICNL